MYRVFSLLILFTVLISGCSEPESATPLPANTPIGEIAITAIANPQPTEVTEPVKSDDKCENPYYPVVDGASWTYTISTGSQPAHTLSTGADNIFTITINDKQNTFTILGQCTDDGIILMDAPSASLSYSGEGGSSTLTTNNIDGVTVPDDIQVGDDWSQEISVTSSSDNEASMNATVKTDYKALGYEIVSVPAGTFNALKVEQSGVTTMQVGTFETHGYLWFAQGIGTVKSSLDDIYTSELVSYNIP